MFYFAVFRLHLTLFLSVLFSPTQVKLLTQSVAALATNGRCSLLNLGFNLGFFELVISFTILPHSQGHWYLDEGACIRTQTHLQQATFCFVLEGALLSRILAPISKPSASVKMTEIKES
ncbi:hypothetical protein ATANTOWER_004303 [Ataeniobius toweri]|uniref:Secreted protein n=1 Tax=Ataeniobius toweri TaxID=208326 RepID=A0ABU7B757_9TELE|nr:hypothetical protein [Ataeniobius toweri]